VSTPRLRKVLYFPLRPGAFMTNVELRTTLLVLLAGPFDFVYS
jgi:hypothetical protein